MEKNTDKDSEKQPKSFQSKGIFDLACGTGRIIGLVMAQSGEISPSQRSLSSVDELLIAAGEDRIEKAVIQSDPKGGDEWYTIQGKVTNPAFEIDENQYRTLPFIVKGRVTETDYKELRALLGNRLREEPSSTIWTDLLFSLLPFPFNHWLTILPLC